MKDARTALEVLKKDAFSAMGHMKHRVNQHGMVVCSEILLKQHQQFLRLCFFVLGDYGWGVLS